MNRKSHNVSFEEMLCTHAVVQNIKSLHLAGIDKKPLSISTMSNHDSGAFNLYVPEGGATINVRKNFFQRAEHFNTKGASARFELGHSFICVSKTMDFTSQ